MARRSARIRLHWEGGSKEQRVIEIKNAKLGDEDDGPGWLRAELGRGPGVEGVYEGGAR